MWLILLLLYLFTDRGNDNWLIKYEQATTQGNGDGKEVGCRQIRPRDYKTFFMLNLAEHEISTAHKC